MDSIYSMQKIEKIIFLIAVLFLSATSIGCSPGKEVGDVGEAPEVGKPEVEDGGVLDEGGEEEEVEPTFSSCENPCSKDSECDDNIFCNGAEKCIWGCCEEGETPCKSPSDPCFEALCIEETHLCIEIPRDEDGDGFPAKFVGENECNFETAGVIPDCDDFDPNINPSAEEICDMKDNNCNGVGDEGGWAVAHDLPVRTSSEGMNVVDSDITVKGERAVITWIEESVDGNRKLCIATYQYGEVASGTTKECVELTAGGNLREVSIEGANNDQLYIAWVNGQSSLTIGKLDGSGPDLTDYLFVEETTSFEMIVNLNIKLTPSGHTALLTFRGENEGRADIYSVIVNLDSFTVVELINVSSAPGFSGHPSMAIAEDEEGEKVAVVWQDGREGNSEIFFATLTIASAGGTIEKSNVRRITFTPGDSINPSIVAGEGKFTVVWSDNTFGNFNIASTEINLNGTTTGRVNTSTPSSNESHLMPRAVYHPVELSGQQSEQVIFTYCSVAQEENLLMLSATGQNSQDIPRGIPRGQVVFTTHNTLKNPEFVSAEGKKFIKFEKINNNGKTELFLQAISCSGI